MHSLIDHRRWVVKSTPESTALPNGGSEVFAKLISVRTNGDPDHFLKRTSLHDPKRMHGVDIAVKRLIQAIERDDAIFIHGDFDVDGMTSTALMYLGLRRLGLTHIKVEIEDRKRGHGLNDQVVQRLISEKFSLLITTDSGISDVEHVKALKDAGIDSIITDHHTPPQVLPDALALVNPKLPQCTYPNKDLAGVGVAFQLLRALYEAVGRAPEEALQFIDLAMLGTVADLVPLMRNGEVENHEIVRAGLDYVSEGHGNLGLKTLMDSLGLDATLPSAGQLSFVVSPHLNAANRVGDPRVALLLLTTQNPQLAQYLAETLIAYNQDRKLSQTQLSDMVGAAIEEGQIDLDNERLVWLEGEQWNPGILGLVASYVVDQYGLPVILISKEGLMSRASARSVPQFDMMDCLQNCESVFNRYGGHAMAAGFTIPTKQLPEARELVLNYARNHAPKNGDTIHEIDGTLRPEEISLDLHQEIQQLAPFGVGNPTPRFLLPRAQLDNLKTVGSGRHLKCWTRVNGTTFETIGFTMGDHVDQLMYFDEVGLVFRVGRNDWLGQSRVQLELTDVVEPTDL